MYLSLTLSKLMLCNTWNILFYFNYLLILWNYLSIWLLFVFSIPILSKHRWFINSLTFCFPYNHKQYNPRYGHALNVILSNITNTVNCPKYSCRNKSFDCWKHLKRAFVFFFLCRPNHFCLYCSWNIHLFQWVASRLIKIFLFGSSS